jgi:hypothetical protein
MPRRRLIPEELSTELLRLYDGERCTYEAIADWLKAEHDIAVSDEAVRATVWRIKGQAEQERPDNVEPAPEQEPADPADALQVIRYQLGRDARNARVRMIRDPGDADAGKLYVSIQSLRVRLLVALRQAKAVGKGAVPAAPEPPAVPAPRFLIGGKAVDLPS